MNSVNEVQDEDSDVKRLRTGGVVALGEYFEKHRRRLKTSVSARIDRRLTGQLDDSDIIQQAFVEATERLDEYLDNPRMPLFVWLRFLAQQAVSDRHREFFGTQKRNLDRQVRMNEQLIAKLTTSMISPHSAIVRAELAERVRRLISLMPDNDREILTMVHLEALSLPEAAAALELPGETVRKRHQRAVKRLRAIVADLESEEK